jgi:Flp pilus assembly protein TadB
MDTSPEAGTRRRSPQLMLGWAAFALFLVGIAISFVLLPVGFALVGVGAVLLIVSFVLELRTRKAVQESEGSPFAEGGTFGGRRSPQTHSRM